MNDYYSKRLSNNMLQDFTLLLNWVDTAPGVFNVNELTNDHTERFLLTEKFEKLVAAGYVERVGTKRGAYRKKEVETELMDFKNVDAEPVGIWLPFEISDLVEIYEGNLIIIAGMKSAGKTAVMLNLVYQNMNNWDVDYFNSEMGSKELRKRLELFPYITIDNWIFNAYRRASKFEDVIEGGTDKLILIDFLEIHDEFYAVGRSLKAIHDKLKGAICVVALQKNPGQDVGLGGWRSAEVTRLYLSLDKGRVKITDAKNYRTEKNPNGLMRDFKLYHGCEITTKHGWYRGEKE